MSSSPEVQVPFQPNHRQWEAAQAWYFDPAAKYLLLDGAIRSGKTQAGGRLIVESALVAPCQYLIARATYRELADTIQRAIMYGDGAIPALVPAEVLRGQSLKHAYVAKDETVHLANGAELVFRSLEEHATEKIRGLTLGGFLIDQGEELKYEEGEKVYDEAIGRLSDPRGPKKGIVIANPSGLDHWIYRRWYKEPDVGSKVVHFTLEDNRANLDPAYFASMEATQHTRPYWYKTFILGLWGALQDAAYDVRDEHRIERFELVDAYDRYECADYGLNGAPWCLWCTDFEGNLIAVDMLYVKDTMVSDLAALVHKKRETWGTPWTAYADPSLWARSGAANVWGRPMTLADEFELAGLPIEKANNDPRAGMARLQELLKLDPEHPYPSWHPRAGEMGAPRIFFTEHVADLTAELQSAPKQPLDKRDGGEIVDPVWEGRNGHAAAMARYAAMVRPEESHPEKIPVEDPKVALHMKLLGMEEDDDDRRPLASPAHYMG